MKFLSRPNVRISRTCALKAEDVALELGCRFEYMLDAPGHYFVVPNESIARDLYETLEDMGLIAELEADVHQRPAPPTVPDEAYRHKARMILEDAAARIRSEARRAGIERCRSGYDEQSRMWILLDDWAARLDMAAEGLIALDSK